MEPISAAVVGKILWDNLGQPVLEKAKEQYAEKFLEKFNSALSKLPFKKKELEVIAAEIINAKIENVNDEKKFLMFMETNQKIVEVLSEVNQREKNININVGKGVGYIDTMNGDMNF